MPIQRIPAPDGRTIVVRHAFQALEFIDAKSVPAARAELAAAAGTNAALPAVWQEALAEHEMTIDQTIVPTVVDQAGPAMTAAGIEAKVEVAAPPPPGHTLLLGVQVGDVMQWFAP